MSASVTQANVQANNPVNNPPTVEDERDFQISLFVAWCLIGGILAFACSYNAHYAMVTADEDGFTTLASFCQWRVAFTATILFLQFVFLCMSQSYGREWSHKITAFCSVNFLIVVLSGLIHVIMTRNQKAAILTSCAKRFDATGRYHLYYPYAFLFWHSDVVNTEAEAAYWCRSTWNSSIFWDIVLYVLTVVFAFGQVGLSAHLKPPEVVAGRVDTECATQGYSRLAQDVEARAAPSAGGGEQLPPYPSTSASQ